MSALPSFAELENAGEFHARHIGPDAADEALMLSAIGAASRSALISAIVPAAIKLGAKMDLPAAVTEAQALAELKAIAGRNQILKSFIGQGYHGTLTPGVILRNILENPAWYTAYTPYQAEISQGRMEALVNFQTMVCDLTGLAIANASMLDEATAAAEAMTLAARVGKSKSQVFFVADDVLPQTLEVVRTRAEPLGITVQVGRAEDAGKTECFGALVQYPGVTGVIRPLQAIADAVHAHGGLLVAAADLLALTLIQAPGEQGVDIAVGTTQRFGMPMGAGGPHAAYMACRDEFKRSLPGRLVGVSIDSHGKPAYRLSLQTREQHIRREKATSNICTAQVLPAVVASMYVVYHGPQGLKRIAQRVAGYTAVLAQGLKALGLTLAHETSFDTLQVQTGARTGAILAAAVAAGMNLRQASSNSVGITLDEATSRADVQALLSVFADGKPVADAFAASNAVSALIPAALVRTSAYLTHPIFNIHHSETEMLRYIRQLSDKDLALDRSMIPLGSCTMKLNATSEMIPITWPEFAQVHPFAPQDQLQGYAQLNEQLTAWLCQATGYAGVSLQPNAGSQGEYAGLLVIKAWHESRGDAHRKICLIPESAHGTNPASAQMVGMQVVVTKCDKEGNIDLADLKAKCEQHSANLAAIMITYPSTYGVFDTHVKEICALVHEHGGRVYVDGANMNALVGVAAPGQFGGDVSHLNLHKTFCIPHGGGGPGVGPVCVVEDLVPFLPAHRAAQGMGSYPGYGAGAVQAHSVGAVSAAPLGNAAVLPISWMYIRMMGEDGLTAATETAILSANYVAARLSDHYDIHFSSNLDGIKGGGVAHECILDLRPLKDSSGISAEDVAKRLIDYGFHAPTLSFPVAGTLMVEPTESESKFELDRFIGAMIQIRGEIARVESGAWPREDNPLVNAPHTAESLLKAEWAHGYSRDEAAYPVPALRQVKYWSPVGRVDNVYGDRNLVCSCPPLSAYEDHADA
ncbi:aminomethyl-transferring glycine dehydrogenase [Roseateles amylovorans]|uniref:Glycine dehydrogenase (decarboxylating) n=1 Tax=Roseateles amylovorans TaxID=2978473 RepID=A0ABY6AWQ0_9BURK|nr:aminomethyl-transferring glycine dehydrogenase [Roseateles amylovorans]UXH76824.1 aminomethyl-transferring glycine dehydrogenase [Roseateles amylovorans]